MNAEAPARIRVHYFASLRDRAGVEHEVLDRGPVTAAELYADCEQRHALGWPRERLRVAVNGRIAGWEQPLADGDQVVFLPPVSGG